MFLGQHRVKLLHHIELDLKRLAIIHIREIASAPAKGLCPRHHAQTAHIDPGIFEELRVLGRPVFPHHPNQADTREKACGQ